jgi:hypothetical protein
MTAFLLGAVVAGAAAGGLAGAGGSLALPSAVGEDARLAALAAAIAIAIGLDVYGDPAPGPRRQVNERWLDQYRGWVYGLGFGAQLGVGVTTVISSAATYVALAAAFMSGTAAWGALIVGCFGAVRGLTPLAAARVDRPERLMAFHARFDRSRVAARRSGPAILAVLLALAIAGALV